MKELTKAEEQIMQILWEIEKGFVKDVLKHFPEPRPAYNTVSTIIRILQDKGFVSHRAYGRTHEYYPLVSKEDYTRSQMTNLVSNYFSNSFEKMISFFAREKKISLSEMEDIIKLMEKEISNKKKSGK
ncbi:MAG: BlaI/MecI/CopY family transcriptional regulator [Bacteroidales bacterium]|nr:BlaI/MecI/CopY family transcriptional regulator [Bacteroidales bacterium]